MRSSLSAISCAFALIACGSSTTSNGTSGHASPAPASVRPEPATSAESGEGAPPEPSPSPSPGAATADDDAPTPREVGSRDGAPRDGAPRDRAKVFFSGHSLINVNTPTFFAQLARSARHEVDYELQMGLGSTMSVRLACPRNGQRADGSEVDFDTLQTLRTGRFDTLVLTERNDIVSTILYERTTAMTRRYVEALRAGQPEARAFLFESWPAIEGRNYDAFRARVRREHVAWECVASRVNHRSEGEPMRVMPTGPAIADLLETITSGRAPGIQRPEQLFNDDVHLTNLGNYYVALLYYGVVFGRSPEGLTASALRPIAGEPPQLAPETVTFLQAHAARWARKTFEDEAGTRRSEGECIRELEVLCRATLGANAWGCTQVAGAYRDDRAEVPDIRDAWCRR